MTIASGHIHKWQLTAYEYGILRGECECEAVEFFAADSLAADPDIAKRLEQLNQEYRKEGKVIGQNHPVPPKPEAGGMHAVHRYYEENKEAILHDLDTMGEKEMRKRWHNMSQATFFGLMARWRPEYPGIPKWGREKAKRVKRETPGEGRTPVVSKKVQELEVALTSKSKEVETLREQVEQMKQAICTAPVLVVEAYKAVATFTGEITKTVAAYGLKDADAAVLDSQMNSFDSLTGLLGDWIKLLKGGTRSDFDKGAIFALGMINAVFECERNLEERLKELMGELQNGQRK